MTNCANGELPWFDSAAVNQCFGHTFDGWNPGCCVVGATLCMRLKATGSVPSTDRLMLGDWSDDGGAWAIMMGELNDYAQGDPSWDPGDIMTVCIDLADLPPSTTWPNSTILPPKPRT